MSCTQLVLRQADEVFLIATTALNANAALLTEMLRVVSAPSMLARTPAGVFAPGSTRLVDSLQVEQVIRTFISKERLTADIISSKSTQLYGLVRLQHAACSMLQCVV